MTAPLWFTGYFTVLVPWSATPTEWHPTEDTGPFAVLTRGAFRNEDDARYWAITHLKGEPYSLRWIRGAKDDGREEDSQCRK